MATSSIILTNGSAPSTPAAGKVALFTNASKILSQIDDAGVSKAVIGGGAAYSNTIADQTGTTNTTGLMMGLGAAGATITPVCTGRIRFALVGNLTTSGTTIGNGAKTQLYYGTGSAPANGAALTGNAIGSIITSVIESTTASTKQAVALEFIVSSLTLNTALWIDASLAAIVAGTASLSNVTVTAMEF